MQQQAFLEKMKEPPRNTITLHSLDGSVPLADLLGLKPPPFRTAADAFVQLKYLEDYVRRPDWSLMPKSRTVAIEGHYIDRDFMADHGVLFSSTLWSPPNHCRRVLFFAGEPETIEEKLRSLGDVLIGDQQQSYAEECRLFSEKHYLGFSVIRPLPGCPVGRTVLRLLPEEKQEDDSLRKMNCVREYDQHLIGVTLSIRGLAFQQQDLGVSRCSTVALWCALHKTGDGEAITHVTPAEVTTLASRYRLPFGRPMPSEGLAVDQMCLALQSVGIAPSLVKVMNFPQGRSLIYSATLSGIPSILIMQKADTPDLWHAVTVVGMKLRAVDEPCLIESKGVVLGDDRSGNLKAVYVQDDRIGPYRRAEILCDQNQLRVRIKVQSHVPTGETEVWIVRQVLTPMHPKIRINFNDLRSITLKWLIPDTQVVAATELGLADLTKAPAVRFEYWIERGFRYVQRVLTEGLICLESGRLFRKEFVMPRYLAVIRLRSSAFGSFDVLVDTTSPKPNYTWLAVIALRGDDEGGQRRHLVAEYLAERCGCRYFA